MFNIIFKVTILISSLIFYLMNYNREDIEKNILEWVNENIDNGFEFREHQLDACIDIIYNILNHDSEDHTHDNGCQIIEAPTGSGKSLINIISACVLNTYYNLHSYILASDLYLWQQYYDFIKNNSNIRNQVGCLKGKFGNYHCRRNQQDISLADCQMAGLSWQSLFNPQYARKHGFSCAINCKYIKERKHALNSNVTLLTYQLYFLMVNAMERSSSTVGFNRRDVIFCDECHNIPQIIQMEFSTALKHNTIDTICDIYDYAMATNLALFDELKEKLATTEIQEKYKSSKDIVDAYEQLFNQLTNYKNTRDEDYDIVIKLINLFTSFNETIENIMASINQAVSNNGIVTKEDIHIYHSCQRFQMYVGTLVDFIYMINICGKEYFIKQITYDDDTTFVKSIEFHCAKEDFMIFLHLLCKCDNKVLISATVGDQDSYEETIGLKYFGMQQDGDSMTSQAMKYLAHEKYQSNGELISVEDQTSIYKRIPSTFDFSRSPIYFLNKYRMGFNERKNSLPHLRQIIYKICEQQFNDMKGIIQTGSYQIARDIIDNAPLNLRKRFLYYNGSVEKIDNISIHKMSKNTILIGPTLNEGIDLPQDHCRFILILKVPYPQIKDKLVEAKMKLFPHWYNYITSNQIIQGIGRGNRSLDDWCITYILDACFMNLFLATKSQYPQEIIDRIKIYN